MTPRTKSQAPPDQELSRKLDVVIGLLAELCARSEKPTDTRKRIRLLHQLGVPAPDIARAVGKQSDYVRATLSQLRRQATKKKGKKNEKQ